MRKTFSTKDEAVAWISRKTQKELSGREIPAFSDYLEVIARITIHKGAWPPRERYVEATLTCKKGEMPYAGHLREPE